MERYTFNGDGVYPVVPEWNTSTTTVTVGSFPEGVTVAVGVASSDGWSPLDGGDLTSGSTVTLTHGHDAQLQVLISGLTGSVTLDFRKEGTPSQYNLLEQIAENTMSPIKEEAPVGGHWRNDGSWELDPIQEDAPVGPHARSDGGWVNLEATLNSIDDKLEWFGPWVETTYEPNSVVSDQGWLMVSNTQTDDKAAPQPLGTPITVLPDDPGFTTGQNSSVVYTGHLYTFTEGGWFRGLRAWVPTLSPTTNYRFVVVKNPYTNPEAFYIEEPILLENGWTTLSLNNTLVKAGEQVLIYIDALDSGTSTTWQYPWTYGGRSSFGAPATGQWNTNNSQTTLRIAKDDGDGTNHNLELQVITGTTFTITQLSDPNKSVTYRTTGTFTDNGTHYSYPITEVDEGSNGVPDEGAGTQIRADQPVASPTDYVEVANYWDTAPALPFATVQGFKQYDGVDQPGNENNAYGIDIAFQRANISKDWDVMAFSGEGSGAKDGVFATNSIREDDVLRVAWKPTGTYPILQVPDPDEVPNTILYTDVTSASSHVDCDVNTGVFTFLQSVDEAQFSWSAQIMRLGGGGVETWGMFFEIFDGQNWVEVPDSTRFLSLDKDVDDEHRSVSYTVYAKDIIAGTQMRLRHVTTDTSDNIGLVTDKPFTAAPVAPGIIVSISTHFTL